MIRDITIGQYYPTKSVIHSLDPRVKFVGTIAYIVSLFLFDTYYGFIPAGLALAGVILCSRIPFKFIFKGLKSIFFLLIIMMLFNFFLTPGEPIWSFWIFKISEEGISNAVFMGIRLIFLVLGSSLMTYTTTPNKLTDGMERIFSFLKVFRVPVHEVAMMISIALRFIPILLEETDKIMKAQQARGADFESGNIFKRAKALLPLLVPLIVSAFRRAGDLAEAMESRCYHGGKGRTKLNPLKYSYRDAVAYVIIVIYLVGVIIIP